MKKETRKILGEKNYLLGINHEGEKVWLQEASFDCGWYWGFGYVEIYNKNYSDIETHTHFNGLFLKNDIHTSFKEYFQETPLNDKEIWELLELMQQFYIAKDYAELLNRGGANISHSTNSQFAIDKEANKSEQARINEQLIPSLFNRIYDILGVEQ